MSNENSKIIKYIDGAIFVLVFIYLASLTNSIFVNQIGYFLSLILLITRSIITKRNAFKLTGMEIAIGFMLFAEIIATIFATNIGQSFHNLLKFSLLLPTLYLFSSSVFDFNRLKLFFKIYMGFALISCFIYLILSYDYIIYNQFQIQQSGPSPFKFPITASELISFTVVFFFAFLINEKTSRKNKILLFLGFVISSLALLVIYKRTGWFGTAAGILFVLIYAKKWKIVIPFFIVAAGLIVIEKSSSELYIFAEHSGKFDKANILKTAGRAYDVSSDSGSVYLSDFENGLSVVKNDNTSRKLLDAPSALASFSLWKGNYYTAYLNDTRFILYQKKNNAGFENIGHFISPGFTTCYKTANGYLYVCDSDSGVTVFRDPLNLKDSVRFRDITGASKVFVDSSALIIYSAVKNEYSFHVLQNGLPSKTIYQYKSKSKFDVIAFEKGKVLISDKDGISILSKNNSTLEKIYSNKEIKNTFLAESKGDTLYLASFDKKIYKVLFNGANLNILSEDEIGFVPGRMAVANNKVYLTKLHESRFASTFDKYNMSNLTRLALWSAGWKIFNSHPIVGVGNIDLAKLYIEYKNDYDKEIQGHMHNNFVHILVTLGIIGFAAFLFLLYKMLSRLNYIYKKSKGVPFLSSYVLGAMGGVIAFIVAGLTEWNFGDHEIITMVWFSLGLSFGLFRCIIQQKQD